MITHPIMHPTLGTVLAFLLSAAAHAQSADSAPPAEAPPPVDEAAPYARIAVDPELATAAARDAAAASVAPTATAAAAPATPMASLNPDISFIMNTAFGWFSRHDHLRQGGHAVDENGFTGQALELAASSAVDPYFRFDFYFQVQHLHLEEAFLTTLALPAGLQARAGYFNVAFGRQNPRHLHAWQFVNPTLSHTRFMSAEHFSGTGAELSMLLPLPWYALLLAEVITPSTDAGFRSVTFGTIDKNGNGRTDGIEDFVYVGRLENFFELSADLSLLLGAGAVVGQSPYVPDNRAALYGGDVYLKWRPSSRGGNLSVALTLEGILRDTQVPGDTVRDVGGYAQLEVQPSLRWLMALRGDVTDLVRGQVPDPIRFPGRQARGSLALTFLPTHFSKVRLQADLSHSEGVGSKVAAVFLQTEISAGSHGAHSY
jgi:hypothetical protein